MGNDVKLPTVWLSPQLLAAARLAATQNNRKLGAYLRSLILRDCILRNIPIEPPPMLSDTLRLHPVARSRQKEREKNELDEPD